MHCPANESSCLSGCCPDLEDGTLRKDVHPCCTEKVMQSMLKNDNSDCEFGMCQLPGPPLTP